MEEQKNMISEKLEGLGDSKIDAGAKVITILGYILPVLFFVPLFFKENKNTIFAKFHANQQIFFLIFLVVGLALAQILKIILIGYVIAYVIYLGYFVFMIMGIINASRGENKALPFIGGGAIIK